MPRNLTEEEKQEIYKLHDEGRSIAGIANELNLSRSTVRVWVRRYQAQVVQSSSPKMPPTQAYYVPFGSREAGTSKHVSNKCQLVSLDDVVAFMGHVKARPLLYDKGKYQNMNEEAVAEQMAALWGEVSLLMNWSVADCKERWKCLTLEYLKKKKRDADGVDYDEEWHYGSHLDFIEDKVSMEDMLDDDDIKLDDANIEAHSDDECEVALPKADEEEVDDPLVDVKPDITALEALVTQREPEITQPIQNTNKKYKIEEVNEKIQRLRFESKFAESYFDFFRSLQLDFNELTDDRKEEFMKECASQLARLQEWEQGFQAQTKRKRLKRKNPH